MPGRMWQIYRWAVNSAVWLALAPGGLLAVAAGRWERRRLDQRLGRPDAMPATRGRILLHAVSAGEMRAAETLIRHLHARRPQERFVLSTGTRDGWRVGRRIAAEMEAVEAVTWLPWDRPVAQRRWLEALRPALVVTVETELWPGLFEAAGGLGIPLAVASARIRPGDVGRYRRVRTLMTRTLSHVTWIGSQTEDDRRRFLELGAIPERVEVAGNLKCDVEPAGSAPGESCSGFQRNGKLVVAASTHRGEEAPILEAYSELRPRVEGMRLVLAPRKVARAPSVARRARRRGLDACLSSQRAGPSPNSTWDALVVDEIGHLTTIYQYADVVIVGGTLRDVGGHTPLEAAVAGCAVLVGPHAGHFAYIIDALLARDAALRFRSAAELCSCLARLLDDETLRSDYARRAREAATAMRGPAERHAERLARLLEGAVA